MCLFDAGADEENTWRQIQAVMETRRRLTEVEGRMQERPSHFHRPAALTVIQAIAQLSREFIPEIG